MGCIVCRTGEQGNAQPHSPGGPAQRKGPLGPKREGSTGTRDTSDLSGSHGGLWRSLHFCGMRWKFETIKKGEGRDRKEKERKSKETIKCYHLAGASRGDETANEPKVLQSPAFNSNQTDNHPRRPCPSAEIVPSKQGWVGVPAPDHAPICPAAQLWPVRVEERGRNVAGNKVRIHPPARSCPVVSLTRNILEHHPRPAYPQLFPLPISISVSCWECTSC